MTHASLKDIRQYRIIQMCGLRSQKSRQMAQKFAGHPDGWSRIFGTYDEHLCKQGVRRELCGVAIIIFVPFSENQHKHENGLKL